MNLAKGKNFINTYLDKLCEIGERHVGSDSNRQAVDFFYDVVSSFDYDMQKDEFNCIDWEYGEVFLKAGKEEYTAFVSPYSLPCDIKAELVVASTLEELKIIDACGKILVINEELTKEQIMPKNFVFYNPEEHKQIVSVIEDKMPKAIICVTVDGQGVTGGLYPFPIFEDGDFNIPSVYMKDIDGRKLIEFHGQEVQLAFESKRIPTKANSVIARKNGRGNGRIVLCAHIDTKKNTPGALDNATGIAVLMGLADQLKNYNGPNDIEIIAFNGEDHYSVPAQMLYLKQNDWNFEDVNMVINIDGVGHKDSKNALSFYNLSDIQINKVLNIVESCENVVKGEEWYEGDHSMFLQKGVPSIAVTSSNLRDVVMNISHTSKDTIDNVDEALLWDCVNAITEIINTIL